MTTTKKSYGFRLSKQAEHHLNRIVSVTGMTKTAAVEMAIAQLSKSLKGEEITTATFILIDANIHRMTEADKVF